MKERTKAEYDAWLNDVSSKLPESLKPHFKALAEDPAGFEMFGGHLRESTFYQKLEEVNAVKSALEAERQKFELEQQKFASDLNNVNSFLEAEIPAKKKLEQEAASLRRELEAVRGKVKDFGLEEDVFGNSQGAVPVVKHGSTEEELRKEVETLRAQIVGISQTVAQTVPKILGDFSKVLKTSVKENIDFDPDKLIEHSLKNKVDLSRAFDEIAAPERQKRLELDIEQRIKEAEERGRKEAMAKVKDPAQFRPAGPNIVDALSDTKTTPSDPHGRINAAVQDFLENKF